MKSKTKPATYLMESEGEGQRLEIKDDREQTRTHLRQTGFDAIPPNGHIIDAGAGIGAVSSVMLSLLAEQKKPATLTLIDRSIDRLAEAKNRLQLAHPVRLNFLQSDLAQLDIPSNSVDYIFSRFVFEYLHNPQATFAELVRLVKPGGKIVIGDLDYNCLTHYPLDDLLDRQLKELTSFLTENQSFDPFVGRKLYSFFHQNNLKQVRVHVSAHHIFYGKLAQKDEINWTAKLDQLIKLQQAGTLSLSFKVEDFKTRFMRFLKDEGRFSYTPLILVEGVK